MSTLISIVLPCFNEEKNIPVIYSQIINVFNKLNKNNKKKYSYEIIFIDNSSDDLSRKIIRDLCNIDHGVKAIFNTRNFGYIKSPYYGLLNTSGDASVLMCSDLQEPPHLIKNFIHAWESGSKIVMAVKSKSDQNPIMNFLKRRYYNFLAKYSECAPIPNTTGFGLYDKSIIDILKKLKDPYPFLRGVLTMIGHPIKLIKFEYSPRNFGLSKSKLSVLYDYMFLGLITHTRLPLRLIFLSGLFIFISSMLAGFILILLKIFFWDSFFLGYIPIIVSILFFAGIQMLFIGIIGEYLSYLISKSSRMPLVVELERINFD